MTAEELCRGMNPDGLGTAISLQAKLKKHLELKNQDKIRNYLITIRALYPDFNQCPIDLDLLKEATTFLKENGWELHLGEGHQDNVSLYVQGGPTIHIGDSVMVPRTSGEYTPGKVEYIFPDDRVKVSFPIGNSYRGEKSPYPPNARGIKIVMRANLLAVR